MGYVRDEAITRDVGCGVAELEPDPDRPGGWTLRLNGIAQSYVDLTDPRFLEFPYVRCLAHLVDVVAPAGEPLRTLHLGGGALTLPRYVAATRPGSDQRVVEVDAGLIELVLDRLPLDPSWRLEVRRGDAREALAEVGAATVDLIVSDVFDGPRVPAHLTSVEYLALAAAALRPTGVLVVNTGDGGALTFVRAQVATMRAVFPQVCALAGPSVWDGQRFGNVILIASHRRLPVAELADRLVAGRIEQGESLVRFAGDARPVTDETATRSPAPPGHARRAATKPDTGPGASVMSRRPCPPPRDTT